MREIPRHFGITSLARRMFDSDYALPVSLFFICVIWKLAVHFRLVDHLTNKEDEHGDINSWYGSEDDSYTPVVNWWEREEDFSQPAWELPFAPQRPVLSNCSGDMGVPTDPHSSEAAAALPSSAAPPSTAPLPSLTLPPTSHCVLCGNASRTRCSQCHVTQYCSSECQKKDWSLGHKDACPTLRLRATSSTSTSIPQIKAAPAVGKVIKPAEPDEAAPVPKLVVSSYDEFLRLFDSSVLQPPSGLVNCGNTCFANAMLQCLLHLRPLSAYLLERHHTASCPVRVARPNEWCLTCHLEALAVAAQAAPPGTSVSPRPITLSTRRICRTLSPGRQEDSHEFCISIVDHMASIMLKEHELQAQAAEQQRAIASAAAGAAHDAAQHDCSERRCSGGLGHCMPAAVPCGDGVLPASPLLEAEAAHALDGTAGAIKQPQAGVKQLDTGMAVDTPCNGAVSNGAAAEEAAAGIALGNGGTGGGLCNGIGANSPTSNGAAADAHGDSAVGTPHSNGTAVGPLSNGGAMAAPVKAGVAPASAAAAAAVRPKLDMRSQETTMMHHIFAGYVRWQTICTSCHHVSQRFDLFNSLHVQITPSVHSVESGLEACFSEEWLDDDNKYKCDSCNDKVRACRRQSIEQAPNVLMICFKRYGAGRYSKINKRVTFSEGLDLSPFMARDAMDVLSATYCLAGIVVHLGSGNSTASGHYISYVRIDDGRWFECDDTHVRQVSAAKALNSSAYMLFYQRTQPKRAPDPRYSRPLPLPCMAETTPPHGGATSTALSSECGFSHSSHVTPLSEQDAADLGVRTAACLSGNDVPHVVKACGSNVTVSVQLAGFAKQAADVGVVAMAERLYIGVAGRCGLNIAFKAGLAVTDVRCRFRRQHLRLSVSLCLVTVSEAVLLTGGALPVYEALRPAISWASRDRAAAAEAAVAVDDRAAGAVEVAVSGRDEVPAAPPPVGCDSYNHAQACQVSAVGGTEAAADEAAAPKTLSAHGLGVESSSRDLANAAPGPPASAHGHLDGYAEAGEGGTMASGTDVVGGVADEGKAEAKKGSSKQRASAKGKSKKGKKSR